MKHAGGELRHWDGGTGPAVLFTHGAGADHVMFEAQAAFLRGRGYRVITWDLRGHGLSRPSAVPFTAGQAVEDLLALMDHLKLNQAVLAGQSLGGNLGQAVARRHPERVRALVVIGSTWNAGPLSRLDRLLLAAATPMISLIPARRLPALMADASATTAAARADARRAFSLLSKREFLQVWRAAAALVAPDPGYRTPVPLCLIRGEHDRTGNIATSMPRWAAAEGITENVVPGAGHIANQDAPDEVNTIIETFLREVAW